MGRQRVNVDPSSGLEAAFAWGIRHRHPHGELVGLRIRRLRQASKWTQMYVAHRIARPEADGRPFSPSYLSRVERGYSAPPLWFYCRVAEVFGVDPGRLLGPDELETERDAERKLLLDVYERLGITPAEAIARLARGPL